MSIKRKSPVLRRIESLLVSVGCADWEVRPGKKHDKLFVRGRMVAAITRGADGGCRQAANLEACVRRAASGLSS